MASPPSFEVEDQTDEDFFDKLVDDDEFGSEKLAAELKDLPKDLSREFSNLSLGDLGTVENSGDGETTVAEEKVQEKDEILLSSDMPKSDLLQSKTSLPPRNSDDQLGQLGEGNPENMAASGGKKGTGVKEVKWSSFSAGSEKISNEGFESYSEFAFGVVDELQSNVKSDFSFVDNQGKNLGTNVVSSEVEDTNAYGSTNADVNDPQYWENLYPGWKYDATTAQWYQVDTYDASSNDQYASYNTAVAGAQETVHDTTQIASDSSSSNSGVIYLQQAGHSMLETIQEDSTLTNVPDWNMVSQPATEYPPNMVFDPQYPGWYYDTNTTQWYSLESYNQTVHMTSNGVQDQMHQDASISTGLSGENHIYNDVTAVTEQSFIQEQSTQGFGADWNASTSYYSQESMWQPTQNNDQLHGAFPTIQQTGNFHSSFAHSLNANNQLINKKIHQPVTSNEFGDSNSVTRSPSFVPGESMHQFNQMKTDRGLHSNLSNSYYGNQNPSKFSNQSFQGGATSFPQFSYPQEGRSSIGRPAHAIVKFGFGGKLIVMKNISSFGGLDSGAQGATGATISVLDLSDAVKDRNDASSIGSRSSSAYFNSLFQQVLPGPLVGGSAAMKDVNKWLDDRITSLDVSSLDNQKAKLLKLLLSLLKISCQHYGKLRSPFGSDPSEEGTDGPEMAVTNLFASVKRNSNTFRDHDAVNHCMQNIPSEGQIQATAIQVQNLLVTGRRQEALQFAQEGQLWGPALVLAARLGDKFYVDTVRKMAHSQFISGCPLRTLCLLIAGQPADVFSPYGSTTSPSGGAAHASQVDGNGMLSGWEENLAIITANRTKDDELVMIHLGDCLWKEKGEVVAAHTCYLVAEAKFEMYSDSARLCLIGSDHWKYPRTYACPDAIQRTEIYEYSKVLGNSQFILQPFQPYKLIYACMLAEVGKISDSLRYCQASLKLLKNSSRAPEVEMVKSLLSSLEERLRTHQQGGYGTNLAPAKLVGKLFTSIDRSIHRMMGAPSASLPPVPQSSVVDKEVNVAPKVANSQSTMAMSSLVPSASVEAINDWTGDSGRKIMHNRSISEPDFGRTPKQDGGSDGLNKDMAGGSRFGRFGFGTSILQKTIGWVSRSHRQAKLGESNKFYYDEKLKRWVEEGAAPPAEETALPPPPKVAPFQNGVPDYSMNNAFKSDSIGHTEMPEVKPPAPSEYNSGIPPIPPSQNQFSARGRVGVRSRYVDTFNKGGGVSTPSFQSPAVPSLKPMVGSSFFVPTIPVTPDEQRSDSPGDGNQEPTINEEATTSTTTANDASFLTPGPPTSTSLHRHTSMDSLPPYGNKSPTSWGSNGNPSRSRAASWSGTYPDTFSPPSTDSKLLNVPQRSLSNEHILTSFMPVARASSTVGSQHRNGGSLVDELQEVEL